MATARRILIAAFRLLVTAGLLGILVARFDLTRVDQRICHASPPLLTAALAALLAALPANALRWRIILAAEGPMPDVGTLLKLLFVGMFFNQVLPTGIGGDAVRAWRCRKLGIAFAAAIRSVVIDRASGYLVMVALYTAGLPVLFVYFPDLPERAGLIVLLAAALGGLLALTLLGRLPGRWLRWPILRVLAELSRTARQLFVDPGCCAAVIGLSIFTVGFTILAYMLIGEGIGVVLPFGTWLLVVPPVSLIQLLPVSLAGWGVREAGLVLILARFGVSADAALAASVLLGLSLVVVGLPGGVIWLVGWDTARPTSGREPTACDPGLPG